MAPRLTPRRAVFALWGLAALLAAPWAIEAALIALRQASWLPPANLPAFRLDTPRNTDRRTHA